MPLLSPSHRTVVCLLFVGLTDLCGCEILTDTLLADFEMSAFLTEADSHVTRSRGWASRATAVVAADQCSVITDVLSLSWVRSDVAAETVTPTIRVGAVTSSLIQAEPIGLEIARLVLDQAMQGENVEAIMAAFTGPRHAVATAESVVPARRSSTGQGQVAAPGEESLAGGPGRGGDDESVGTDRPGGGEPESFAQVDAPSDNEPLGPQDSAESAQGPPS